jgi:hypothetical protein
VFKPFFFAEHTVIGEKCPNILRQILMLTLEDDPKGILFQQSVTEYLHTVTLQLRTSWIKSFHTKELEETTSPSHSPELIPFGFLFWGYTKGSVHILSLPTTWPELAGKVQAAAAGDTRSAKNVLALTEQLQTLRPGHITYRISSVFTPVPLLPTFTDLRINTNMFHS